MTDENNNVPETQQDREVVAEELKKLHETGAYPEDLRV